MYFESRTVAGSQLAELITKKYADKGAECAVVALSDGGVVVGAQIAQKLTSVLMLLLTKSIMLPREEIAIAGIAQDGSFSYNHIYADVEIEELVTEYYHYIEQEKIEMLHELHRESRASLLRKELLRDRTVFLVSDGLKDAFQLDIAMEFLKPLRIKRLVMVTPFSSVPAIDRVHILADEIYCLDVIADFFDVNHYYERQDVPSHERIVSTIEEVVSHWK